MALVAKRTAAAGGADATVNSAVTVAGVIDALLIAAGWTLDLDLVAAVAGAWTPSVVLPPFNSNYSVGTLVTNASNIYQCITTGTASTSPTGPTGEGQDITDGTVHWRFLTSAAGTAKVYKSTGESGNENLWCRVVSNTNATPAVNIEQYQYFDPTAQFGFNLHVNLVGNVHQYTYTAATTVNYAMTADKDNFEILTNDSANLRRLYGGGLLKRAPGTLAAYFISNAQVTAGLNKTFSFASGDPVAAGYKIGDRVFVLAQEANAASPFNGKIPSYAAAITALTTSSITIDNAQETTAAGAFIGADPQPYFSWVQAANNDPNSASVIFFPYRWNATVPNVWNDAATPGQGYGNAGTDLGLITQASPECDPNNRTNRVVIGEYLMAHLTNEIAGILPKIYSNPRLTDALWAIARTTKEATPQDYVVTPANTASPSGQRRLEVGPFATSGSANFNADLYQQDFNTWIEAPINVFEDKSHRSHTFAPSVQMTVNDPTSANPGLIGQLMYDDDAGVSPDKVGFNDVMPQGVLHENTAQDKTIEGQGSPLRTGGETYPFDTSTATQGGSGSSFNSGFN